MLVSLLSPMSWHILVVCLVQGARRRRCGVIPCTDMRIVMRTNDGLQIDWVAARLQGRLHSTRLLSLYARMPLALRAVFGGATRPFYLLEDVVVDLRKQSMEVRASRGVGE